MPNGFTKLYGKFATQRQQLAEQRITAQAEKAKALEERRKAEELIRKYRTPELVPKTRQFERGARGIWVQEMLEKKARGKFEETKRVEAIRIEREVLPKIATYEKEIAGFEQEIFGLEEQIGKQELEIKGYQEKGYEIRETPEGKFEFFKMVQVPVKPVGPKLSGKKIGLSSGQLVPVEYAEALILWRTPEGRQAHQYTSLENRQNVISSIRAVGGTLVDVKIVPTGTGFETSYKEIEQLFAIAEPPKMIEVKFPKILLDVLIEKQLEFEKLPKAEGIWKPDPITGALLFFPKKAKIDLLKEPRAEFQAQPPLLQFARTLFAGATMFPILVTEATVGLFTGAYEGITKRPSLLATPLFAITGFAKGIKKAQKDIILRETAGYKILQSALKPDDRFKAVLLGPFGYPTYKLLTSPEIREWAKTEVLLSPAITDIVLPAAAGYGGGLAFGLISKAGAASIGVTAKVLTGFAKTAPWVVGGTFSGLLGAEIGYTAAFEEHKLMPSGATARLLTRRGMQIGSAILGGYAATRPGTLLKVEQIGARIKQPFVKGIQRISRPRLYPSKLQTKLTEFTRRNLDIRIAKAQIRTQVGLRQDIKAYVGRDRFPRIRTGLVRAKGVLFEPTAREILIRYGLTKPKQPFGQVIDRYEITTREQLFGVKYRDVRLAFEQSLKVPSRYETFAEQFAIQKQLRFRLGLMKDLKIATKTDIIVHPKKPYEAIFETRRIGKDIFSRGKITLKGETAKIVGKTYYKLSPEDIFYQTKPFRTQIASKYLGDIKDLTITETTGLGYPLKEIRTQLYGQTFKEVRTGIFKPVLKEPIVSKGYTIQKDIYAGETFIKAGFLEQFKYDISLAISKGAFRTRVTAGTYKDISRIFKPKIKEAEYFGEPSRFDYRGLPELITKDIAMPGGISVLKGEIKPIPSQFEALSYQRPYTLEQLEFLEIGITPSQYWSGIIQKPIMGVKQITFPITITSQIPLTKITQLTKQMSQQISKLQTIQIQKLLDLRIPTQKTLLDQLTKQMTIQETLQMPLSIQLNLQQQLQQQQQIQLQKQIQSLLFQPMILQTITMARPTEPIRPIPPYFEPIPYFKQPPPTKPTPLILFDLFDGEPKLFEDEEARIAYLRRLRFRKVKIPDPFEKINGGIF